MRVGFVTQLLWSRYGLFWQKLFESLDAEIVFPTKEDTLKHLSRLNDVSFSSYSFKIAAAQALSLDDVDFLVVPDVNYGGSSLKGSGQDPWIADFPETLQQTFGALPKVIVAPANAQPNITEFEAMLVDQIYNLVDAGVMRRAWGSRKSLLKVKKIKRDQAAEQRAQSAVLGQAWYFNQVSLIERLNKKVETLDATIVVEAAIETTTDSVIGSVDSGEDSKAETPIVAEDNAVTEEATDEKDEKADVTKLPLLQTNLDPAMLRQQAGGLANDLLASDQEILGASRYVGHKGNIKKLYLVVDSESGADAQLLRRIEKQTHKAVESIILQEHFSETELFDLLFLTEEMPEVIIEDADEDDFTDTDTADTVV